MVFPTMMLTVQGAAHSDAPLGMRGQWIALHARHWLSMLQGDSEIAPP
jgi:hypothetical protein